MADTRKMEAQILEALDRVESLSTRESGIRILKDIVQEEGTSYLLVLKLSFHSRNRNIWKVVMEPIVSSILMIHSTENKSISHDLLTLLLKNILNCITEQSCHATCTELTEKIYRESRNEYVPDSIVDRIPYARSPGIAMCFLNISHVVIDLGMHVEKFATSLFRLHADNRYQFIYNEWILCLSEFISQSSTDVIGARLSEIVSICVECSRVIMGESNRIRLTRDIAMASCVFLSVVPRSVSPSDSKLSAISSSIIKSLRRDNLHLFALTRCFPKLRSAISAAFSAWSQYVPCHPRLGRTPSPTRPRSTTAESIRTRAIEAVTQHSSHSSPAREPPEPHLETQVELEIEKSFRVETTESQRSTRWAIENAETDIFQFEADVPRRRVSVNAELEEIIESGTEENLVEFLFIHSPLWAAIIDDNNVVILFHLIVGMMRESKDCPSVMEKLLEHIDACDERVASLANRHDIVELRDILVSLLDSPTTVQTMREKVGKTLRCMFAQ